MSSVQEIVDKIKQIIHQMNVWCEEFDNEENVINVLDDYLSSLMASGKIDDYEIIMQPDCSQYFNAPCVPREYRYFSCYWDLVSFRVGNKVYVVRGHSTEGYYCSCPRFRTFDEIWVDEYTISNVMSLIYEKLNELFMRYGRPEWVKAVFNTLDEIHNTVVEIEKKEGSKAACEYVYNVLSNKSIIYEFNAAATTVAEICKTLE